MGEKNGRGGTGRVVVSVLVCAAILAVGAAAIGGALLLRAKSSEAAKVPRNEKIPNVSVQALEALMLEDRLALTGTLEPWEDVVVSAETIGQIGWQGVEEGQQVKAGDVLLRIDTRTLEAQLAQARAEHKLALQEFARCEQLTQRGAVAAQALDNVVASRDVAAANVRLLEVQLAKSVVHAPFAGIVDRLLMEKGEFVDTGTALARLVQVHKVKVCVGIPERDIRHFASDDMVRVVFDALPGQEFEGRIHRIATTADMITHTFEAQIELDNPEGHLKPGMMARTSLVRSEHPDSIVIPIFASVLLDEDRYVYVVEDGKACLRKIQVGIVQGSSVQVTSGLSKGELLVVTGQYDARDGEPVQVTEER